MKKITACVTLLLLLWLITACFQPLSAYNETIYIPNIDEMIIADIGDPRPLIRLSATTLPVQN